ncbi:cytochrome c-type biogenesis protein [Marinimicrobium sp. C2-29]|uniref:cytochrome c-type biogenesis protein n=1 Tax=Marinimicrobium sp. C2-29 TaxID=3139825 RepID=UPI003139894A
MIRVWVTLGLALVVMASAGGAMAAVDVRDFDSESDRQRYQSFIDEMRCPKCQNQNLAGSDSPIAEDLRDQVYRLIDEGKSDKEIIDFMVERYGEYILYRPRLSPATLVLWLTPVVLMLVGIVVLIRVVLKRRRTAAETVTDSEDLSPEERRELDELLRDSHADSDDEKRES